MDKVYKEEEIDLLALFLQGVRLIQLNFWLIFSFFAIGTVIGLAYYYSAVRIYKSSTVISSGILTKSYAENLITNINRHRAEGNVRAIAELLKVDERTAQNVTYLQIESVSETDESKETDRFIITVDVLDPDILPSLQMGLIHYFENNEYVKIRVVQNTSYIKQMLAKIDAEIKDIESFKQKLMNGEFFQGATRNLMFDPTEINSKIIELTKEKLNLENNLQFVNSVQVIEGFTKFQRPSSPKLSVSLIAGSLVGLFFVAILLAFKSIRKILRMADTAQQNR